MVGYDAVIYTFYLYMCRKSEQSHRPISDLWVACLGFDFCRLLSMRDLFHHIKCGNFNTRAHTRHTTNDTDIHTTRPSSSWSTYIYVSTYIFIVDNLNKWQWRSLVSHLFYLDVCMWLVCCKCKRECVHAVRSFNQIHKHSTGRHVHCTSVM